MEGHDYQMGYHDPLCAKCEREKAAAEREAKEHEYAEAIRPLLADDDTEWTDLW